MGKGRLDVSCKRLPQFYVLDPRELTKRLGIWFSPARTSLPVLTLFGSTNLNSRSAHLDTELSFVMVVPSEDSVASTSCDETSPLMALREQLRDEIVRIRDHAGEWQGEQRRVRYGTKVLVSLVEGML